jgi:hypothetical protein
VILIFKKLLYSIYSKEDPKGRQLLHSQCFVSFLSVMYNKVLHNGNKTKRVIPKSGMVLVVSSL